MNKIPIDWLLEGPPWVEYRTRLDLLGQSEDEPEVVHARTAMLADPQVQELVADVASWPGIALKSHKKAGHLLHKLGFLADIGLRDGDPGIDRIVLAILKHRSSEGPFQLLMNVKPQYGGTGEDQYTWMLCDAPLVTSAMARFGLGETPEVQASLADLVTTQRENGWPCTVSTNLGKFRGPGRKDDPCPYANLLMLKLLTQIPEWHNHPVVKTGVEVLLSLWEERRDRRPYLFAMGTDFAKLKAPQLWYGILHVVDTLTQIPWAIEDKRLQEMMAIIEGKAGDGGKYTAESIWMDWKEWEFGQKKEPSRWITLVAHRILGRPMRISN